MAKKGVKKDTVKEDLEQIKQLLNDRADDLASSTIEHFSKKDIIISFFGAMLVGSGFIFKGKILEISQTLNAERMIWIFIFTILILLAEIYFIGYSKVKDKKHRPFWKFAVKRIATVYCVSLLVGYIVVPLYNVHTLIADGSFYETTKIVIAISFPASIGAALTDLLKKF